MRDNFKRIDVWSYEEEYAMLRKKILKTVDKVFKSGQLILGNEVSNFENNFSKFTKNNFAIGVNSGTDALQIILMSLNIGEGDEVITTSNTAVPTISAIVMIRFFIPFFIWFSPMLLTITVIYYMQKLHYYFHNWITLVR